MQSNIPIAIAHMQIGVANAGGDDLDEDLARPRLGHGDLLHNQRLAVLLHNGSLHRSRDRHVGGSLMRQRKQFTKPTALEQLLPDVNFLARKYKQPPHRKTVE